MLSADHMSKNYSHRSRAFAFLIILTAAAFSIAANFWGSDIGRLFEGTADAAALPDELAVQAAEADDEVDTAANGLIYFASNRVNGRYKIFSIMEDGRGLTCVGMCTGVSDPAGVGSTDPSTGRKPAVSPDGTKVAYVDTGVIKIS